MDGGKLSPRQAVEVALQQDRGGNVVSVSDDVLKEINVLNLIKGYRTRGHLFTKTNPVRERRKYFPDLSLKNFGLRPRMLTLKRQNPICLPQLIIRWLIKSGEEKR